MRVLRSCCEVELMWMSIVVARCAVSARNLKDAPYTSRSIFHMLSEMTDRIELDITRTE